MLAFMPGPFWLCVRGGVRENLEAPSRGVNAGVVEEDALEARSRSNK